MVIFQINQDIRLFHTNAVNLKTTTHKKRVFKMDRRSLLTPILRKTVRVHNYCTEDKGRDQMR